MPKYDVVYTVKDERGFTSDVKQATVETPGPQTEWFQLAVSHQENVAARQVNVTHYRSK